mgnify:FL=1|jgi:hypothetical protein
MDHRISYRTVTHVVEITADEILKASGAKNVIESFDPQWGGETPYVQWVNKVDGFTGAMISWNEHIHD